MQNLLAAIASGKLGSSAATSNVKEMLDEVQAYRDTKAADAFYETLDRTLNDLKASPDSMAFRNPVKRSEAPDYDTVIKNPMDLSTMQKKVKSHIYENKAEFAEDLNLIWENCLTYNTDETHPLRRLALLMKRRADHILDAIADIGDIKLLAKPKPRAKMSQKERERLRERDRVRAKMQEQKLRKANSDGVSGKPLSSASTAGRSLSHLFGTQSNLLNTNGVENGSDSRQQTAPAEEPVVDGTPLPALPPRTPAAMARFLALSGVTDHHSGSLHVNGINGSFPSTSLVPLSFGGLPRFAPSDPFPSLYPPPPPPPPQRRKRTRAEAFDEAQAEALAAVEKRSQQSGLAREATPNGKGKSLGLNDDLLQDWWGDMMKPELLCAGVPELNELDSEESAELPPRKRLKSSPAKKPRQKAKPPRKETLRSTIESNIGTLREVRKVKEKLARFAEQKDGEQSDEVEMEVDPDPLPQPADPPRPGYYLQPEDGIKNSSYSLLRHAGFEGASKVALDVINSVAADYIKNIGRTMRHYLDTHSTDMPPEEIVLHTLFENGVTEVNQLERYVRDDVQRYGGRLQEILRKLQTVYREQVEKEVAEEEDFDEEEEIMAGGLEDIMGEDYFGFKAMGLAEELGMASLSIPKRLLLGKPKKSANGPALKKGKQPAEKVLPYPPPPAFIPVTEDNVEKQIGLLRDFYRSKLVHVAPPPDTTNPFELPPGPTAPAVMPSYPGAGLESTLNGKKYVPEDPGNASKTKIGPKGEILLHAPPPGGKKKKPKSEKGAGSEPPPPSLPAPAPTQPKQDDANTPTAVLMAGQPKPGSASPAVRVANSSALGSPDKRNLPLPRPAPPSRANSGSVSPTKPVPAPRPPSSSNTSQQGAKLAPSSAPQPPIPPQGLSHPVMAPPGWPGPPYGWPPPPVGSNGLPGPAPSSQDANSSFDAARAKSRGRGLPGSASGRGSALRGAVKSKGAGRMPPPSASA